MEGEKVSNFGCIKLPWSVTNCNSSRACVKRTGLESDILKLKSLHVAGCEWKMLPADQ